MQVLIVNQAKNRLPRKFIQNWMEELGALLVKKRVLKKADLKKELTVVFLEPKEAKKLNSEFRQKNYATDVLSFDSMDDYSMGELILCPAVLVKQAAEHGLSYQHELGYMLLHGVLHLLGYDHETGEEDAREMFSLQDSLFEQLLEK